MDKGMLRTFFFKKKKPLGRDRGKEEAGGTAQSEQKLT